MIIILVKETDIYLSIVMKSHESEVGKLKQITALAAAACVINAEKFSFI